MNAVENLMSRRSIRKYTGQHISDEDLNTILTAAMAAPTAVNARDWSFVVVRDKETLNKMADINGPAANPLRGADLGILVCGDMQRAFQKAPDFWIIDGAIAAENMCLCANALGIGSCWLGTWPLQEKVKNQAQLLGLPSHIVPHSIIAFGYPDEVRAERSVIYEEDRVHFEKW